MTSQRAGHEPPMMPPRVARGQAARRGLAFAALAAAALGLSACSVGRASDPEMPSATAPAATSPWPTPINVGQAEPTWPPTPRPEVQDALAVHSAPPLASLTPALGATVAAADPTASAPPSPTGFVRPLQGTPTTVNVAPADAPSHRLAGPVHTWQKWNNCGPSSAVMALSAFGIARDQLEAAAALKPHDRDTNVTPEELADYLHRQGVRVLVRPGGDRERARALLRAGAPVIAEQWIDVDGRGEMGHYRVLFGYDDALGAVLAMDSYYGPNREIPYDVLEAEWRPFVGTYVVAYRVEQEPAVRAALGPDADAAAAWTRVRAALEADAAGPRASEAWTWFALGEARERTGDGAGAIAAFERAVAVGLPTRAFWYQFGFPRALAAAGAWDRLLAQADATTATMDEQNLEEWHYWRGRALRGLGREAEAVVAFEHALQFNANLAEAHEALDAR